MGVGVGLQERAGTGVSSTEHSTAQHSAASSNRDPARPPGTPAAGDRGLCLIRASEEGGGRGPPGGRGVILEAAGSGVLCNAPTVNGEPARGTTLFRPPPAPAPAALPSPGLGSSDVSLHPPLQGSAGVGVLGRGLRVVGGGGGGLAGLVELHVAVLLAAAADAAVTLRVQEGAAVAEGAPLELPLAQLDGRAAHAQHEPLPVVVEAALAAQGAVDVGEGHPRGHALLASGAQVRLAAAQRDGGGRVVLFEGVDTVVAVGGVLGGGRSDSSVTGRAQPGVHHGRAFLGPACPPRPREGWGDTDGRKGTAGDTAVRLEPAAGGGGGGRRRAVGEARSRRDATGGAPRATGR